MRGFDGTEREALPSTRDLARGCFAEFFAMALFVFFGCGSAASNLDKEGFDWDSASVVTIAFQFGLGITVLAYATAHTSGGHINSAVTIGLTVVGKCHPARAAVYILSQMAGSILGAACLKGATHGTHEGAVLDRTGGLGSNGLQRPAVTIGNAITFEMISTFLLVFVVLETAVNARSVTTDGESAVLGNKQNLAPLPIGLAVFMAHVVCIPVTGCSINPTRSFGPAVVSGVWQDHWIWWVAPITGSLMASLVWGGLKLLDEPKQASAGVEHSDVQLTNAA